MISILGRRQHTQNGYTACGGFRRREENEVATCSAFTGGEWTVTQTLDTARYAHTSWLSPLGLVLIGGHEYECCHVMNAKLLSTGTILFTFEIPLTKACGISQVETVVLTGGTDGIVGSGFSPQAVVYNTSGFVEQLPDLVTPRKNHACGSYVDSNNQLVRDGFPE